MLWSLCYKGIIQCNWAPSVAASCPCGRAVLEQWSPLLSLPSKSTDGSRQPEPVVGRRWHSSLQVPAGWPSCWVTATMPACPLRAGTNPLILLCHLKLFKDCYLPLLKQVLLSFSGCQMSWEDCGAEMFTVISIISVMLLIHKNALVLLLIHSPGFHSWDFLAFR